MIGAPVTVWPGCGIAFFVDVMRMPENAFGYVPTPAPVAPIEFTLGADDDEALGGHMASVKRLDDVVAADRDHLRLTGLALRQPPADAAERIGARVTVRTGANARSGISMPIIGHPRTDRSPTLTIHVGTAL